jgi:hypothetical protein
MSTRNIPGGKGGRYVRLKTNCAVVKKSGSLNFLYPSGTAGPDKGELYLIWCAVLLEKLSGFQLIKKFPAFYVSRRFITAFTSVCHLSLS